MNYQQSVHIGKYCSHEGCKLVGQAALRVGDFWVVFCDEHRGGKITLDMNKCCDVKGSFSGPPVASRTAEATP